MPNSKAQIDRLGERLRHEDHLEEADRELYESYRQEHEPVLREVQASIIDNLGMEPSSRLKTLESARSKLQRQSIRLSQMSDVAGARLVVPDLNAQEEVLGQLGQLFPSARLVDHRNRPQFGYRAVHLIVHDENGRQVEIQLRTTFQNAWANMSESAANAIDVALKYGGGPAKVREFLTDASELARDLDATAVELLVVKKERLAWADELDRLSDAGQPVADVQRQLDRLDTEILRQESLLDHARSQFAEAQIDFE